MVYTKDVILFAIPVDKDASATEMRFDAVPLFQIDRIHEMHASKKIRERRSKTEDGDGSSPNELNGPSNEESEILEEINDTEPPLESPEETGGEGGIEKYSFTFEVHTIYEGFNSGRAYYLQVRAIPTPRTRQIIGFPIHCVVHCFIHCFIKRTA